MLNIKIKNIEKVTAFLRTVELGTKTAAGRAMAEYLIGDVNHGLKHYPSYRHVPYSEIGGFVSDRQRRYVMARISEGSITPGISASNGYFRDAWRIAGEGPRYIMRNDVEYGGFLVGDNTQALRPQRQGWRKITQNISDNIQGAIRHATAKVNEWLRANAKK